MIQDAAGSFARTTPSRAESQRSQRDGGVTTNVVPPGAAMEEFVRRIYTKYYKLGEELYPLGIVDGKLKFSFSEASV